MFDHLGGRVQQRARMGQRHAYVAGQVEDAERAAGRCVDWRRDAGQEAVTFEEVFVPDHCHRTRLVDRRADGVGSHFVLVPAGAWHQRDTLRAGDEAAIADGAQDQAFAVGQQDHRRGMVEGLVQVFHDRLGEADQPGIGLQTFGQQQPIDRFGRQCVLRHQAVAGTPRP